ncbi:Ribonuclease H-like domain containing protein [Trema orientale]|uniref:Ribonuclease H-like domain containing protein n=1 Tax=Trema orientale TaxID=63057 RepID=A0A2P5BJE6_TREOI|nr:Ribonuclease H-like domain containing protein [Trema orientale]
MPLDVISDAGSFQNKFQQAKYKIGHPIRSSKMSVIRWELPHPGRLKLNVDVACFFDQGFIGIGAIIRDATGIVCAAMSKRINGLFESLTAELLALREGIRFIIQVIESDLVSY